MSDITFGMEVEVASGALALCDALGLDDLHSYHCRCYQCEPTFDRSNIWTAQEDCTVSGEFISKPLVWGSDEAYEAIDTMERAALVSRATAGMEAGNHVHVSVETLDGDARARLRRLFAFYERHLARVAQGRFHRVRDYNVPMGHERAEGFLLDGRCSFRGTWLRTNTSTGYTYEFRLWNSTMVGWRLHLHAGLSVAMVLAAREGEDVTARTRVSFARKVGPYMDAETLALYTRQLIYTGDC